MPIIAEDALAVLFTAARSQNAWRPDPVGDDELTAAFDLAKWGPTAMNAQPLRVLFVRSQEAKERLKPALAPGNIDKAMTAPVVAILAYDREFHTRLAEVLPHKPGADQYFAANPELAEETAFRNGTLQAAYLMLALRAVGLEVGPMSGFNAALVDELFLAGTAWRASFICGIGHGDPQGVFERLPRFAFDDVARII